MKTKKPDAYDMVLEQYQDTYTIELMFTVDGDASQERFVNYLQETLYDELGMAGSFRVKQQQTSIPLSGWHKTFLVRFTRSLGDDVDLARKRAANVEQGLLKQFLRELKGALLVWEFVKGPVLTPKKKPHKSQKS